MLSNKRHTGTYKLTRRALGDVLVVALVVALAFVGVLFTRRVTVASAAGEGSAATTAEKTVEITFNKVWEGDSGHEDERPSSLTLAVSNANTGALVKEVTLTAADNWTTTETLPYVTDSGGHLAYTVVEKQKPEAYDYSVSTLTNSAGKDLELWTLATASSVTDGVTVLLTNGNSGDTQLYKAEGPTDGVLSGTQRVITEPLTFGGTTYNSYCRIGAESGTTVKDALGWTAIAQGNGFILQNNMEKTDPKLKVDRYLTINDKGELKLTGSKDSATVFSYEASAGTLSASGVTLYGFVYTDDSALADYASTITVTNTYAGSVPSGPTVEVGDGAVTLNATKTWNDNNDAEGQRPDYVDLVVLANGQPAVDSSGNTITMRVSADSNWKGTVKGLPRYDDNGNEISYTVQEPSVPDGYTSVVGTPTVTESEGKAYWVQASTFGTSAADEDTYLIVARDVDDPTRWLGMHPDPNKKGTASWTNKEGHSAPEIPINNQPLSVTTGGVTTVYPSWVSDDVVQQHLDCLWQTEYDAERTDGQSGGTFQNFFLKNVSNGLYLKCNGQGDLVSSPKDGEGSFHYGIPTTATRVTLSNPKSEYPYVLANMKHYYMLNNNHTGDGNATQASVMRIYKRVVLKDVTVNVDVTNTYTPPTGSITVKKIDQQGAKLSGADFSLYSTQQGSGETYVWDGVTYYKVADKTSDENGSVSFDDLKATGSVSYLLVETKAPEGYDAIDPVVFSLPVARNGEKPASYEGRSTSSNGVTYYYDVTYTAVDKMTVVLPQTDGPGILAYTAGGLGVMGLGIATALARRKSSKESRR